MSPERATRPAGVAIFATGLGLLLIAAPVRAQQSDFHSYSTFGAGDAVSILGAGLVMAFPELIGVNDDPVTCVPCDPMAVPSFDRWAIATYRPDMATASDLLRAGLGVITWYDLADEGPVGRAGIVASFESALWAESLAQLVKGFAGRNRPILYTEGGLAVADVQSNQRSWPSGHAATAAALATSYFLTRSRIGRRDWRVWAIAAGALGVGALRVAAAKHFPSDVATGLALGTATAVVVHAIKF